MSFVPENQTWWERWCRTLVTPENRLAAGGTAMQEYGDLLGPEEFRRALHREWSRGQRIGLPLSMISITKKRNADAGEGAMLEIFTRELGKRLRCTDIIGWADAGKLGILLPHTTGNAAWQLIDQLHAKMAESHPDGKLAATIEIEVYSSAPED